MNYWGFIHHSDISMLHSILECSTTFGIDCSQLRHLVPFVIAENVYDYNKTWCKLFHAPSICVNEKTGETIT